MREVVLTSSVLILALLLLRQAFREKISRRVQYALWGLVLVRLLVPVSLPALDWSLLTVAEPVGETITARLEGAAIPMPVFSGGQPMPQNAGHPAAEAVPSGGTPAARPGEAEPGGTPAVPSLTLSEGLTLVWLAGAAGMTVWLVRSNLAFWIRLRRRRIPLEIPGCGKRVYLVEEGLASPCLFGDRKSVV